MPIYTGKLKYSEPQCLTGHAVQPQTLGGLCTPNVSYSLMGNSIAQATLLKGVDVDKY